jgi:hypothetical protein
MQPPSSNVELARMDWNRFARVLLLLGLVALVISKPPLAVKAQSQASAMSAIEGAFGTVQSAERAGANVTGLDATLNQALAMVTEGTAIRASDPSKAQQLFSQSEGMATEVAATAQAEIGPANTVTTYREYWLATELAALGLACVIVYLYLPRAFWAVWGRAKRDDGVSLN